MGNVITRKELEALEEKLPLPDGRLLCSQSESESAIEALMREASRHVSSSPNAESTDWAHVATNLKLLTEDWAGSLDGWVREGMLTGGPRDCSIFYELHGATLRLHDSLAYAKEKLKLRKGGESSGKTRQRASAMKKAICQRYWDDHKSEYKVRKTAYYHLENAWPDLTDEYDFELDFPTYDTFCEYLREK